MEEITLGSNYNNIIKSYNLDDFNEENIIKMFKKMGLSIHNYFIININNALVKYPLFNICNNYKKQCGLINFDNDKIVIFIVSKFNKCKVIDILNILVKDIINIKIYKHIFNYRLILNTSTEEIDCRILIKYSDFVKQKEKFYIFKKMFDKDVCICL